MMKYKYTPQVGKVIASDQIFDLMSELSKAYDIPKGELTLEADNIGNIFFVRYYVGLENVFLGYITYTNIKPYKYPPIKGAK